MTNIQCSFNINGTSKTLSINEDKPLLFVIRDEFGLTGTKLGCGLEQCGSCAVLINGEKQLSCNVLAKEFENSKITTIEGLKDDKGLNIVQEAFKNFNAAQCGYCTSGIIISLSSISHIFFDVSLYNLQFNNLMILFPSFSSLTKQAKQ